MTVLDADVRVDSEDTDDDVGDDGNCCNQGIGRTESDDGPVLRCFRLGEDETAVRLCEAAALCGCNGTPRSRLCWCCCLPVKAVRGCDLDRRCCDLLVLGESVWMLLDWLLLRLLRLDLRFFFGVSRLLPSLLLLLSLFVVGDFISPALSRVVFRLPFLTAAVLPIDMVSDSSSNRLASFFLLPVLLLLLFLLLLDRGGLCSIGVVDSLLFGLPLSLITSDDGTSTSVGLGSTRVVTVDTIGDTGVVPALLFPTVSAVDMLRTVCFELLFIVALCRLSANQVEGPLIPGMKKEGPAG